MSQVAFQEFTQNQLMTQVDSQILIQIDSQLSASQFFDSNELMTQVKSIDSESTHDSALSQLPMSLMQHEHNSK